MTILRTSSFQCPKRRKFQEAKAGEDKEWEKLDKSGRHGKWPKENSKRKGRLFLKHKKCKETSIFATVDGPSVISRVRSWNRTYEKYKGRVVLRGDIVEDDSGSYAVFTEQGSSASQMTAAKVMDVVARLQGCAGQSSGRSISSHPKSECPDVWMRLPRHKWPKSWSIIDDLVVLLERNLYGHPLAVLLWDRQFEKKFYWIWDGKSTKLGMCIMWMTSKWLEDSRICVPRGKMDGTGLTLENQHHFLPTCIWDALNVHANRTDILLKNTKKCSNTEILQEQMRNYLGGRNLTQKQSLGLTIWKDMRKVRGKENANWPPKILSHFTKFQLHVWTTITSRKKNLRRLENCPKCYRKLS